MKILATSDIHQAGDKWRHLVDACKKEEPNVIIIAGDLFPNHNGGILNQFAFLKHIDKYCSKIREMGIEIVLTLGNDDNQLLIPEFEKRDEDGLFHYVADKKVEIDGHEFIGMPYVPDYPFAYKFWCHPEYNGKPRICNQSFGEPILVGKNNDWDYIDNFNGYFLSKQSIFDALKERVEKIDDMSKSIWLIHCPPSSMGLDVCSHGERVGSDAVMQFIMEDQPMLSIHGHIHESPEYSYKWKNHAGETWCVQSGQIDRKLYYSVVEIEDGKVESIVHSIYGEGLKQ